MRNVCVSFAGCGFLGIFHMGALKAFRESGGGSIRIDKALGASAGAIAAASVILQVPNEDVRQRFEAIVKNVHEMPFGAFNPQFNVERIFGTAMKDLMPENAHEIASGKLFISITDSKMKNQIHSQFLSKSDLIDCLICSCFLPMFSGYSVPTFRGQPYLDGGISNNQPMLKDQKTIAVNPLADDQADITPNDGPTEYEVKVSKLGGQKITLSRDNVKRLYHMLNPVQNSNVYFKQGYDLTKMFIDSEKFKLFCY